MVGSLSCRKLPSLYHASKGFVLCSQKIRTGPGVMLLRDFGADTSQRVERVELNQTHSERRTVGRHHWMQRVKSRNIVENGRVGGDPHKR